MKILVVDASLERSTGLLDPMSTGAPRYLSTGRGEAETLNLREWLPRLTGQFAALMPDVVELVPIVADDTPSIRCVPDVLEHAILALAVRACKTLPWGGTVWVTAAAGEDGAVQIEVLENGSGQSAAVTLLASASVCA